MKLLKQILKMRRRMEGLLLLRVNGSLPRVSVIEAVQRIILCITLLIILDIHIVVLNPIVIPTVHGIIPILLVDIILFIILSIITGIILFTLDILIIIHIIHNYTMFAITLRAVGFPRCRKKNLLVI
jgi:hypothetical protein